MHLNPPRLECLEPRRLLDGEFATLGPTGTLTVAGSPGDDHYVVSGVNPGANELIQVERNGETLQFPQRDVGRIVFEGGEGNDYFEIRPDTNSVRTTLRGGAGNDTLIGGQYFDLIYGGVGADLLKGGNQRDTIFGDGGKDRIFGNGFNDDLRGGAGDDKINGGPGDDRINGGRGNDTLSSAGGADTVFGGADNDTGLDLALISTVDGIENLI